MDFQNHPRVCGEKSRTAAVLISQSGSPPRVRGKGVRFLACSAVDGITPACAGKRRSWYRPHSPGRDHPRVCGEKTSTMVKDLYNQGSPPRVRGKGWCTAGFRSWCGIIPACAGKSPGSAAVPFPLWDHPRVCGEKASSAISCLFLTGSPPRVRGKASAVLLRLLQIGITPAYAGKRSATACVAHVCKDHPRVCGEKPYRQYVTAWHPGSPPRVRGKARLPHRCRRAPGITPACAGKS